MTVITDRFRDLAVIQSKTLGLPDLSLVTVPHPVAGMDPDGARERGRQIAAQVWAALTRGET